MKLCVAGVICDWHEDDLFDDGPVALFGPPAPTGESRFFLWGLTLAAVTHVELAFADGARERVRSDGAFGIAIEPVSSPVELLARDARGRPVAEIDLRDRWSHRPALHDGSNRRGASGVQASACSICC